MCHLIGRANPCICFWVVDFTDSQVQKIATQAAFDCLKVVSIQKQQIRKKHPCQVCQAPFQTCFLRRLLFGSSDTNRLVKTNEARDDGRWSLLCSQTVVIPSGGHSATYQLLGDNGAFHSPRRFFWNNVVIYFFHHFSDFFSPCF